MGVAPRPLDLVHPEAVAADVVAQVHRVLDEKGVKPFDVPMHRREGRQADEGARGRLGSASFGAGVGF